MAPEARTASKPSKVAARPFPLDGNTLSMILWYTQDFEIPCSATETLAHARELLRLGLFNKTWRKASSHPRLWVKLLNAALRDDQFGPIVALSGQLPVQVYFKPNPTDPTEYGSPPKFLTDKNSTAICNQMRRVTALYLDVPSTGPYDTRPLQVLMECSAPALHSLSFMMGRDGIFPQGGNVTARSQQLRKFTLVQSTVDLVRTRLPKLESLELGIIRESQIVSHFKPWILAAGWGNFPRLKTLTVTVTGAKDLDGVSPARAVALPSTLRQVVIKGEIKNCLYIARLLELPGTTNIHVKVNGYQLEPGLRPNLRSLIDSVLECAQKAMEIAIASVALLLTEGKLLLSLGFSERGSPKKEISLEIRPLTLTDTGSMVSDVLGLVAGARTVRLRNTAISKDAYFALDIQVPEDQFESKTGHFDLIQDVQKFIYTFPEIQSLRRGRSGVQAEASFQTSSLRWLDPVGMFSLPPVRDMPNTRLPKQQVIGPNRPQPGKK